MPNVPAVTALNEAPDPPPTSNVDPRNDPVPLFPAAALTPVPPVPTVTVTVAASEAALTMDSAYPPAPPPPPLLCWFAPVADAPPPPPPPPAARIQQKRAPSGLVHVPLAANSCTSGVLEPAALH